MPRSRRTDPAAADTRRILDCLRLLVREVRLSSAASELATGLSAAQVFVLRTLVAKPGLSVNDLATHAHTHQSSVSVVVGKLEAAGLIERHRSAADARRMCLEPTAAGRALAARSADPVQTRLFAGLARLPAETRRQLARTLVRWISVIGLYDSEPELFFEPKRRG